jgi:hypothetical protein
MELLETADGSFIPLSRIVRIRIHPNRDADVEWFNGVHVETAQAKLVLSHGLISSTKNYDLVQLEVRGPGVELKLSSMRKEGDE